jgi:hypothetical protein
VQAAKFEAGHVYFPKNAPYLPELEAELLTFPKASTTIRSTASPRLSLLRVLATMHFSTGWLIVPVQHHRSISTFCS